MSNHLTRREALLAGTHCLLAGPLLAAPPASLFRLATFSADVTPPLGHPLLAGWRSPAKKILDRLTARGWVLLGTDEPVVLAAVDWCELRNDAYDRWRDMLAKAAGTSRRRVLLACVHQHDAPYADLTAQRLLDEVGLKRAMFDPEFHDATLQRVAAAVKASLAAARPVTHLGTGQAKVEQVACNRRVQLPGQPPRFNRYSFTRDAQVRDAPHGTIDPYLKTISFWNDDVALAAVHMYATHPMSYYGRGEVSTDFVGLARTQWHREHPSVETIYLSGCAGDVTAAKYNDGTADGRKQLAQRLYQGMESAWKTTRRVPLTSAKFRCGQVRFEPESAGKLAPETLRKTLADEAAAPRDRIEAALGLSWQQRCARGQPVDLPAVDFGAAQLVFAPAEAFVAFALAAQQMRPDSFVLVSGYAECGPGYIPTEQARNEGFVREHGYCWVAEGAETGLLKSLRQVLAAG